MVRRRQSQAGGTRVELAQVAARLLASGAVRSFGEAKRKAAVALGADARDALPDNLSVLSALVDYQRLFDTAALARRNEALRRAALGAMRFLREFEPRLHGPVLYGTTLPYSAVGLHLFDDEAERVARHLLHHRIRFHAGATSGGRGANEAYPQFELCRDGVDFELTVLPRQRLRQRLLDPLSAQPYQYLDEAGLEALLAGDAGAVRLDGLPLRSGPLPLL
jgi:hypothetical protein